MFKIDTEYQAVYSRLARKRDEAPSKLSKALNESALAGQGVLMTNAPIKEGTLRGSHRIENRGWLERVIFPDTGVAPHALFVIRGTKPHDINGNKYLYWKGAKHPVRKVRHPGTKPNDYIKKSIPTIRSLVENNIQQFMDWLKE